MPSPKNPLRYGLKFSQQVHPIDVQTEVWRIADQAGFDHIWPFDHLLALGPDPTAPIFDGWTVLGAMAALTKRARMGLNVTGNLYRHPGLMAKIGRASTMSRTDGSSSGSGRAGTSPSSRSSVFRSRARGTA